MPTYSFKPILLFTIVILHLVSPSEQGIMDKLGGVIKKMGRSFGARSTGYTRAPEPEKSLLTNTGKKLRFFDIATNIHHKNFRGVYSSKSIDEEAGQQVNPSNKRGQFSQQQYHKPDRDAVIKRAMKWGVKQFIFASGAIRNTVDSAEWCDKYPGMAYTTIGCHPSKVGSLRKFNSLDAVYQKWESLFDEFGNIVKAVGECGLDYHRRGFVNKTEQMNIFPMHFDLAKQYKLPMYFHSRYSFIYKTLT